jgi:itaconyl-CoA hydratase
LKNDLRFLTGDSNYFEDFAVGEVIQHARGRTVTEMDNVLLTHLALNTAQAHFNEHSMSASGFEHRITFGGITAAMVIGLSSEDTSENSLAELAAPRFRFHAPVLHGDTIYAFSEVIAMNAAARADCGEILFRHWGVNQDEVVVFEAERRVLLKRRAWSQP